jgi:phage-related minor tail protein/predicted  nucleic acid-binding Zn-ribbon protein
VSSANLGRALFEIGLGDKDFEKKLKSSEANAKQFAASIAATFEKITIKVDLGQFQSDLNRAEAGFRTTASAANELKQAQLEQAQAMAAIKQSAAAVADSLNQLKVQKQQLAVQAQEARNRILELREANMKAGQSSGEFQTRTVDLTSTIGTLAKAAGPAAIAAISGIGLEMLKGAADVEAANKKMQAQLGLSAQEAQKFAQVSRDIFTSGLGDSIQDVNQALVVTKQNFRDLSNEDIGTLSKQALTVKSVFDVEVNESLKIASNLVKNFGIDGGAAMDIITKSFQQGGNQADDLLDTLNEYGVQFKTLGYSADEFASVLVNGLQNGAFNADKVADAVKEFNIRIKDGSTSSREALQELGIDADQFLQKLGNGGMTGKQAMELINAALRNVKDEVKQNQIGVKLYGTQWEDMEKKVILALDTGTKKLSDFRGATEQAAATLQESLGAKWEAFTRKLSEASAGPLNDVIGKLNQIFTPAFGNEAERTKQGVDQLSTSFLKMDAASMASARATYQSSAATKAQSDATKAAAIEHEKTIVAVKASTQYSTSYADAQASAARHTQTFLEALQGTGKAATETATPVANFATPLSNLSTLSGALSGQLGSVNTEIEKLRGQVNQASQEMSQAGQSMSTLDSAVAKMGPDVNKLWTEWKSYSEQARAGGDGSQRAAEQADQLQMKLTSLNPKLGDISNAYQIQAQKLKEATQAQTDNTISLSLNEGKHKNLQTELTNTQQKISALSFDETRRRMSAAGESTDELKRKFNELPPEAKKGVDGVRNALSASTGWYDLLKTAGGQMILGLVSGMEGSAAAAAAAAARIARGAANAARMEMQISSPSKLFAWMGEMIALGLAKGIKDGEKNPVKAMADTVKSLTDAFSGVSGALKGLEGFDEKSIDQALIDKVIGQAHAFFANFNAAASKVKAEAVEATSKYASATNSVVGVLKSWADAMLALKDVQVKPVEMLDRFLTDVATMTARFREQALKYKEESLTAVSVYAEAAKATVEVIKPAVEGANALQNYKGLVIENLDKFATDLDLMVSVLITRGGVYETKALKAAQTYGESVAKMVGVFKPGVDAAVALQEYKGLVIENFHRLMDDLLVVAEDMVAQGKEFDEKGLKAATTYSESLGKVTGTFSGAVAGFKSLQEYAGVPQKALLTFFNDIYQAMKLTEQAATLFSEENLKGVNLFADSLGKTFGSFNSAMSVFKGLGELSSPGTGMGPGMSIYSFISNLVSTVQMLIQQASQFEKPALEQAISFAKSNEAIFSNFKSAVDVFKGLDSLKGGLTTPLTAFFGEIDKMIKLMGEGLPKGQELKLEAFKFSKLLVEAGVALRQGAGAIGANLPAIPEGPFSLPEAPGFSLPPSGGGLSPMPASELLNTKSGGNIYQFTIPIYGSPDDATVAKLQQLVTQAVENAERNAGQSSQSRSNFRST